MFQLMSIAPLWAFLDMFISVAHVPPQIRRLAPSKAVTHEILAECKHPMHRDARKGVVLCKHPHTSGSPQGSLIVFANRVSEGITGAFSSCINFYFHVLLPIDSRRHGSSPHGWMWSHSLSNEIQFSILIFSDFCHLSYRHLGFVKNSVQLQSLSRPP
ncbi:hypothetical protein BDR04DRAFT_210790 [Suillus decipiens]|nr:hypothetical protein BDR04DRAFT_210790 [Suillus decipiens]